MEAAIDGDLIELTGRTDPRPVVAIHVSTTKLNVAARREMGFPEFVRILVDRPTATVYLVAADHTAADPARVSPDGNISSRLTTYCRAHGYELGRYPLTGPVPTKFGTAFSFRLKSSEKGMSST